MRKFYAKNVMSHPVVTLSAIPRVQEIVKVLEETTHNGFPIRDHENRFIGLILRSQLITLLQKKDFRESSSVGIPSRNIQLSSLTSAFMF